MCPPPEATNNIHVILNVCCVRNVTKLSIHGRGLCNEARRDRNQSNKAMLAQWVKPGEEWERETGKTRRPGTGGCVYA